MLTNNWKNTVLATLSGMQEGNSNSAITAVSTSVTDINGTTRTIPTSSNFTYNGRDSAVYGISLAGMGTVSTATSNGVSGAVFGDGTTLPSADDYWISGNKITTISVTTMRSGAYNDDGSLTKTSVYTVTNTGTTEVTISEIGCVQNLNYLTSGNNTNYYFLMDHTLLEEPVTIPPGGVGQVTYSITFGEPIINQS